MGYRSMAAILGGINTGISSYREAQERKRRRDYEDEQRKRMEDEWLYRQQKRKEDDAWEDEVRNRQRQGWKDEDTRRAEADLEKLESTLYDVNKRLSLSDADVNYLLEEVNTRRQKLGKPTLSKAPDVITPAIQKSLGELQQMILSGKGSFKPGQEQQILEAWARQWGEHGKRFIESQMQPVSPAAALGMNPNQPVPLGGIGRDRLRPESMFPIPTDVPGVPSVPAQPQQQTRESLASSLLAIPEDTSEDDKFYNTVLQRIHLYAQQGGMPESIMRRLWVIDQKKGVVPPGVDFKPELAQQFYGMKAIKEYDAQKLGETIRHNKAVEELAGDKLGETVRHNKAMEDLRKGDQEIRERLADIRQTAAKLTNYGTKPKPEDAGKIYSGVMRIDSHIASLMKQREAAMTYSSLSGKKRYESVDKMPKELQGYIYSLNEAIKTAEEQKRKAIDKMVNIEVPAGGKAPAVPGAGGTRIVPFSGKKAAELRGVLKAAKTRSGRYPTREEFVNALKSKYNPQSLGALYDEYVR